MVLAVLFGVESVDDLEELQQKIDEKNYLSSGIKNREFMVSSYFRESNHLLFETATSLDRSSKDLPEQGQDFDEIPLFLPEFLERKRERIEKNLNFKF